MTGNRREAGSVLLEAIVAVAVLGLTVNVFSELAAKSRDASKRLAFSNSFNEIDQGMRHQIWDRLHSNYFAPPVGAPCITGSFLSHFSNIDIGTFARLRQANSIHLAGVGIPQKFTDAAARCRTPVIDNNAGVYRFCAEVTPRAGAAALERDSFINADLIFTEFRVELKQLPTQQFLRCVDFAGDRRAGAKISYSVFWQKELKPGSVTFKTYHGVYYTGR